MTDKIATCDLCGEPMPAGEEMFKFHGYSGSCPQPALTSAQRLERELANKAVAPRVTLEQVEGAIEQEDFIFHPPTLTICVLTLKNGFTVTGESAAASPENFNQEIGERIARQNAVGKIWMLEGYLLRQNLYAAQQPDVDPTKEVVA